jgi:hypothetical protein
MDVIECAGQLKQRDPRATPNEGFFLWLRWGTLLPPSLLTAKHHAKAVS